MKPLGGRADFVSFHEIRKTMMWSGQANLAPSFPKPNFWGMGLMDGEICNACFSWRTRVRMVEIYHSSILLMADHHLSTMVMDLHDAMVG